MAEKKKKQRLVGAIRFETLFSWFCVPEGFNSRCGFNATPISSTMLDIHVSIYNYKVDMYRERGQKRQSRFFPNFEGCWQCSFELFYSRFVSTPRFVLLEGSDGMIEATLLAIQRGTYYPLIG